MDITLQMLLIVCPLVFLAGLVDSSYAQWVDNYEADRGYDENQSIRMTQG